MTRRSLTLLLATVLALGLAVAGSFATVPYVALKPGPTCNTLSICDKQRVLSFSPASASHQRQSGQLQLTTVSVSDHISLFEAIAGWISPNEAVLPREIVYPPDQTAQQNQQQTTQQMVDSQDSATIAAMSYLGYKGTTALTVSDVRKGAPADGKLHPGDVLLSVDGKPLTGADATAIADDLRSKISARTPGQPVSIGYQRDGKKATVTLATVADPKSSPPRAVIGITPGSRTEFPIKVSIRLKDIGGPSAGLMFALGIVDELGDTDLTGGRNIAGTGEIDAKGNVGAIGGIAQKMRGAKKMGATVFLVPADNCEEAAKTKPSGLRLIKVSTLATALEGLATLRSGGAPQGC